MLPLRFLLISFLVSTALVLALPGCSGAGQTSFSTYEEAYQRGMEAYEARRWDRAVENFRAVFDFGRTHERVADAQFYLASSYFGRRDYALAGQEFGRFADTYTNDPRAEEAAFRQVESYYNLSPPPELDQTDTERALGYISNFQARFPNSPFVPRVVEMQDELMDKLAFKHLAGAQLYERRNLHEAAAITYSEFLNRFPTSDYADEALLGAVRSYVAFAEASIPARQPQRFQLAIDAYERLIGLFPATEFRAEADELHRQAQAGREAALRRIAQQ